MGLARARARVEYCRVGWGRGRAKLGWGRVG